MTQAEARDLRAGDRVRTRFGVARFVRFDRWAVAGRTRDYLVLHYAGKGAKLDRQYLPLWMADQITRC